MSVWAFEPASAVRMWQIALLSNINNVASRWIQNLLNLKINSARQNTLSRSNKELLRSRTIAAASDT
jgi:hypothetical protein